MSNNSDYRDTYFGQIVDISDPERPEIIEHINVRAVDYNDARTLVLTTCSYAVENTEMAEGYELRVKRYRPPSLVESPMDKVRRWRRQHGSKGKTKAPQYNRGR